MTFGVAHPERTTAIRAHRRAIAGVLDGLVDGIVGGYEPGLLKGIQEPIQERNGLRKSQNKAHQPSHGMMEMVMVARVGPCGITMAISLESIEPTELEMRTL